MSSTVIVNQLKHIALSCCNHETSHLQSGSYFFKPGVPFYLLSRGSVLLRPYTKNMQVQVVVTNADNAQRKDPGSRKGAADQ